MNKTNCLSNVDVWAYNLLLIAEQVLGKKLSRILLPFKNTFLRRLVRRLGKNQLPSKLQVRRVKNITPEIFQRDFFSQSTPVIIEGGASSWGCCRKWDLDYFKFGIGEENVLLVNASGLTSREDHSNYEVLTVKDLIENIQAGGDKYLRFSPLLENNPKLEADLDLDWLKKMRGDSTFAHTYYMFIGGKGKKTLLHTDQPCNLYVQAFGEKVWTLFSPRESALLYPEMSNTAYIKSPIDVDKPDHERFPLFKYAQAYEAHLRPGDILYVPPHTWHHVENLSDSVAVGYRFSSLKAALNSSITFSLLRILSFNPPIWKTIKYGKIDTNLIWAHHGGKIKQVLKEYKVIKKDNGN